MRRYNIDIDLNNLTVPFDILELPSKGMFYKNNKSFVVIKYLTGIEENLLTTSVLIYNGQALDILLKKVILDKDFEDFDNMLICDRQAIFLFLRSTAFGDKFELKTLCPKCESENDISFNISTLQISDIIEVPNEDGLYEYRLKTMKLNNEPVIIKFRPITISMERRIQDETERYDNLITAQYINQIAFVNGNDDKSFIERIIKKMPAKDSLLFREHMKKILPQIECRLDFKCKDCAHTSVQEVDLNGNILGINDEYKKVFWEESFLLSYYGKGFDHDSILKMPVMQRRFMINRIIDEVEKKNKAEEDATKSIKK